MPTTTTTTNFHPIADIFPLMEGAEFNELVADITANGLIYSIVTHEGMILDGRNRYRACLAAGVEPRFTAYDGFDPVGFVVSSNIHHRHLTAEQKRDVIAKLLKAQPEKSDRQIAEQAKVSPTTVGTVRSEMEADGDVSKLDTRTDTKGRKQPAKKAAPKPTPAPSATKASARRLKTRPQEAARMDADAESLATKLIEQLDRDTVHELQRQLFTTDHRVLWRLTEALSRKLGIPGFETTKVMTSIRQLRSRP